MRCACATYELVAGELAVNAMRTSSCSDQVLSIRLAWYQKVALKPEPLTWILVVALPRKDIA